MSVWLYLAEQAVCSGCLLLTAGLCAGLTRRSTLRLTLTAVAAAAVSLIALDAPASVRLALLILTTLCAPRLAWPGVPRRLGLRLTACGAMLSLWLTGTLRVMATLVPGAFTPAGACAVLTGACLLLRAMPLTLRRAVDVPRCATVCIRRGQQRLTLTALIDSGNLLRDVITGLPVIVISRRAAGKLVLLPPDGSLLPGMRLMTVRTISGSAMMTIFRTDSVRILHGGSWQEAQALIGLSPDGYDGFQALVPASVLGDMEEMPCPIISQGG